MVQKTEDMTRSSVQKSVCVVCRSPLFGRLAVKMELVVRAWFLQGDFSQTKLLEDAYNHLNSCPVQLDQTLEGMKSSKTPFKMNLKILGAKRERTKKFIYGPKITTTEYKKKTNNVIQTLSLVSLLIYKSYYMSMSPYFSYWHGVTAIAAVTRHWQSYTRIAQQIWKKYVSLFIPKIDVGYIILYYYLTAC